MKERWEVRWHDPRFDSDEWWDPLPGDADPESGAREMALSLRGRGMRGVRIVRIVRVEVVYAWRASDDHFDANHGDWWSEHSRRGWVPHKGYRELYADPLGKHSRKRAKKAALAAKPSGPCVLVAVRRRVQE